MRHTHVIAGATGETTDLSAFAWPVTVLVIVGLVFIFFRKQIGDLLHDFLVRDVYKVEAGRDGLSITAERRAAATEELTKASSDKSGHDHPAPPVTREEVDRTARAVARFGRVPRLLWVDDRPSNNRHEQAAFEKMAMSVELSTSTEDALEKIASRGPYDVIISDMGRPPDSRAGYTLLERLRSNRDETPFVIYAASRAPEHYDESVRRGAIGCTNRTDELIELVQRGLAASRGARDTDR